MITYEGLLICDRCDRVITKDHGTPIHLLIGGREWTFHYHNRNGTNDCLKQKLDQWRQQFAQQKEA